jgi:uncharacterized membrane protein
MKALLAMAPICLVAIAYALAQGDWGSAGTLAFIEALIFVNYRTEKRNKSLRVPEHRNEV